MGGIHMCGVAVSACSSPSYKAGEACKLDASLGTSGCIMVTLGLHMYHSNYLGLSCPEV